MSSQVKPLRSNNVKEVQAMQRKLDLSVEQLQKNTMNQALAESFPAWDLNPPMVLVRRRKSEQ